MTTVQRALERRKHDAPSAVLVMETLSKILPDQTYVTELRLEGNKLRLTGITRDAPSLIGLIERSGRFTRATFFAPTTRSPSDTGDRFHIEAIIKISRTFHMISRHSISGYLTRYPHLSGLIYVALVVICLFDDPVYAERPRRTVSCSQCRSRNAFPTRGAQSWRRLKIFARRDRRFWKAKQ